MKTLAIDRCPKHGYWAISVDDAEGGGTRLTPTKCCGMWRRVHGWLIDKHLAEAMIEHAEAAREEIE